MGTDICGGNDRGEGGGGGGGEGGEVAIGGGEGGRKQDVNSIQHSLWTPSALPSVIARETNETGVVHLKVIASRPQGEVTHALVDGVKLGVVPSGSLRRSMYSQQTEGAVGSNGPLCGI